MAEKPGLLSHHGRAALILEVDPIGLVRARPGDRVRARTMPRVRSLSGSTVDDRPYAASSLLSGRWYKTFRTAKAGRCDALPELAATAIPLQLHVPGAALLGWRDLATGSPTWSQQ